MPVLKLTKNQVIEVFFKPYSDCGENFSTSELARGKTIEEGLRN
jgi:hypothetical protein